MRRASLVEMSELVCENGFHEAAFDQSACQHQRVGVHRRVQHRLVDHEPALRRAQSRIGLGETVERVVVDQSLPLGRRPVRRTAAATATLPRGASASRRRGSAGHTPRSMRACAPCRRLAEDLERSPTARDMRSRRVPRRTTIGSRTSLRRAGPIPELISCSRITYRLVPSGSPPAPPPSAAWNCLHLKYPLCRLLTRTRPPTRNIPTVLAALKPRRPSRDTNAPRRSSPAPPTPAAICAGNDPGCSSMNAATSS